VKRLRGYKTELRVKPAQVELLQKHIGGARYIYNWALTKRKAAYESEEKKSLSAFDLNKLLTQLKQQPETSWLYEICNHTLQESIRNLCKAYDNFFRRVKAGTEAPGFPRFHSRFDSRQSFCLRGNFCVESNRVKLPKIGWVRLKEKNYIPSVGVRYLLATISTSGGRWYISMQVEEDVPEPTQPTGSALGVHMGINPLATCSNALTYEAAKPLKKHLRKLERLEREKSRRQKGSANRAKTVEKIGRLHDHVANIRAHNLHQISHDISHSEHSTIVVDGYDVREMKEGQISNINRAFSDVAMGELRRQITYKGNWNGSAILKADKNFASAHICSACGYKVDTKIVIKKRFVCPGCKIDIDSKLNAALNLKNLAGKSSESINACGEIGVGQPR